MVVAGTFSALVDADDEMSALPILVVGLIVVLLGTLNVSAARLLRAIGGLIVLMAGPGWSAGREGLEGVLPVVVIGAVIFAIGASHMWLELIPTSSLVIVISVVNYIVRKVDNEVLQGVTIVATGLTVLVGATMVFKNREHQGRLRSRVGSPISSTRRSGLDA